MAEVWRVMVCWKERLTDVRVGRLETLAFPEVRKKHLQGFPIIPCCPPTRKLRT